MITNKNFTNLEALFSPGKFFRVSADKQGRNIMYGTLEDPYRLMRSETLKNAIETAISERENEKNSNPILIYPNYHDIYAHMPLFALTNSGEFKTFKKGYYIRPLEEPTIKEILISYVNQEVEPKELTDGKDFVFDTAEETDFYDNLRAVLGTDSYYVIAGCYAVDCNETYTFVGYTVQKNSPDKKIEIESSEKFRGTMRLVLQDKKATGNDYPIVIVHGNNSKIFVIDSGDVKQLEKGYYMPNDKAITDIDKVIRYIYGLEMSDYMTPN